MRTCGEPAGFDFYASFPDTGDGVASFLPQGLVGRDRVARLSAGDWQGELRFIRNNVNSGDNANCMLGIVPYGSPVRSTARGGRAGGISCLSFLSSAIYNILISAVLHVRVAYLDIRTWGMRAA